MGPYTFPSHYPPGCPTPPHTPNSGTYYRLVKNDNPLDPNHYKSHYETGERPDLESKEPCGRRAVSVFKDIDDAILLWQLFPTKGKYVAVLNLNGGHGVVKNVPHNPFKTHHNWWVPNGVSAQNFCNDIKEV